MIPNPSTRQNPSSRSARNFNLLAGFDGFDGFYITNSHAHALAYAHHASVVIKTRQTRQTRLSLWRCMSNSPDGFNTPDGFNPSGAGVFRLRPQGQPADRAQPRLQYLRIAEVITLIRPRAAARRAGQEALGHRGSFQTTLRTRAFRAVSFFKSNTEIPSLNQRNR